MYRVILCLLIGLRLTLSVPTRVLTTINSPDGDIIDCTDILTQPAFNHSLLKNHKLQKIPANLPNVVKKEGSNWQVWHSDGSKCPEGTIPIRRVVSRGNATTNLRAGADISKGHEYTVGFMNNSRPVYGTKATMSVGHPKVDQFGEFSLGQIWLVSGLHKSDLNTIEAGWQVCPMLYSDFQPRLFIFWTHDGYTTKEGYNLRLPGFIQVSGSVLLEGAITVNSNKTEFIIQIWKDPSFGHWWLSVGPDSNTGLTPVGYWPIEIFTYLTHYAETVEWGGEIINLNISGQHTTTEMGSGYLPSSTKAAYMRDLEVVVQNGDLQPIHDLVVSETNPEYYKIKASSDTSFSYGGPKQGVAVHLRVDWIFLYVCFSLSISFLLPR